MDYTRTIAEYLEKSLSININWLANELGISVQLAADAMTGFVAAKKGVDAYYTVSGVSKEQIFGIFVVGSKDLEEYKNGLDQLISEQIYSIQKQANDNNNTQYILSTQYNTYRQQVECLLENADHPGNHFIRNTYGEVRLPGLVVKPVGDRVCNGPVPASSFNSSIDLSTKPTTTTSKKATVASKPLDAQVKAFFAKDETAGANKNTSKPSEPTTKPTKLIKPVKQPTGLESDDEEWEDNTYGKATKATTKRKEREETLEKSPEETPTTAAETVVVEEKKKKAKSVKSSSQPVLAHGAMDDYMEDVAIEQFKQQQERQETSAETPAETQQQPPPKMKKVLVEKTSLDDKGYLITENVWEEVLDLSSNSSNSHHTLTMSSSTTTPGASQDTVPSQSKPQVAKSNNNNSIVVEVKDKEKDKPKAAAVSSKASNNKKDNNKSSAGQKSMMSFFGKK